MGRLRTFVAVPLDAPVRARVAALQVRLGGLGGDVKWVEAENLHVTLLFLGEVDERGVVAVCRLVDAAVKAHAAFPMEVGTVNGFPNLRRPRTVWAGLTQGADEVTRLHADLEATLEADGIYRRENRAFEPHVTLGRVADAGPELLAELGKQSGWRAGRSEVREVQVLSSVLNREGPVYTVLSRARLGRAGSAT